jgi:8-oxo-dGTP pyrophosphatase MutT (NUDIX family)
MPSVVIRQAGAIPIRGGQICLVTSRRGKRWIVPKGWLEDGRTPGEVAIAECWEEAGVVGILRPEPVGSYLYQKDERTFHVTIYVLDVTEATDDWPEVAERERVWVTHSQALSRLEDPGLRDILRRVLGRQAG